jgi:hypothetical protein
MPNAARFIIIIIYFGLLNLGDFLNFPKTHEAILESFLDQKMYMQYCTHVSNFLSN